MKTVLVDDHALFRDGVASLLLVWGREVAGRDGEGEQSVEFVEAGAPDEVLMDVRMPASGPTTGEGEPSRDEVAIVVLTVSAEEAELFRAIKAGAQGHLPPTLEAPRLRSMLEGVARGEPAASGSGRARVADEFLADRRSPGRVRAVD
jgi:two-component system nitrate/nitrite response regulator NarL